MLLWVLNLQFSILLFKNLFFPFPNKDGLLTIICFNTAYWPRVNVTQASAAPGPAPPSGRVKSSGRTEPQPAGLPDPICCCCCGSGGGGVGRVRHRPPVRVRAQPTSGRA